MKISPCHCVNLRRANKAVTEFYDLRLRPCGVTISQFSLLRNLERLDDASVSDLAHAMGLERSTLVRNLRPLFEAGLIEDRSAAGSRNRQLHLTRSGKKVLTKGGPLWDGAQREFEEKLGGDKLEALYSVFAVLQE